MSIMSDEKARWVQVRHGQWVRQEAASAAPESAPPENATSESAGPAASSEAPAGSIAADTTGGVSRRPLFERSTGSPPTGPQVRDRMQALAMEPANEDPLLNPGPSQALASDGNADDVLAAGPAVDPISDASQSQTSPAAPSAPRPYVPDFVRKPGAQRSQDEKAAEGSTTVSRAAAKVASGAKSVADFAQSVPVAMVGAGASTALGGNVTETVAHGAQLAEIAAIATARNDPVKQSAFARAREKNRAAKEALAWSTEAVRSADSGKVGDKTIKEILADPDAHTRDEVAIASQAHNHIKRRERNKGKGEGGKDLSDGELLRATPFGGRTKQMVQSVMANVDLGVKADAIGERKIDEYRPELTMGTAVAPELVKDGKVLDQASRPQSSWTSAIGNFFSSLNPWSSRPMGNTTQLTPEEQAQVETHEGTSRMWDQQAANRKSLRLFQEMSSGGLQDGYTPEEFTRKTALKQQISSLEATAASEKSARSAWYRPSWAPWGPRFNEQEQQRYDSWGNVVSSQDAAVKANQEAAIAGHQSQLDELEAAKAASLGQRSSNWLPWKSGSYHFTDDEQAKYDSMKEKADAITGAAAGSQLTSEQHQELARLREDMHEMEQVRDTGLSRDQRQRYSSLQTSIAATKSNSMFGLSEQDIAARHTAMSEQEEMTTTLKTGLNRSQRDELQRAKDEREEQRQFKKTGLTKEERESKAMAEGQAKDVYRGAAAQNDFLGKYGGQTVRDNNEVARARNPELPADYRVGGLKYKDVTEEDKETTAGGWFAQAGRTFSGWLSTLGDFIKGRSTDARRHIEKGDLGTAAAISASGLAKEGTAFAGGVALPGVGGKLVRNLTEGVGGGVQGLAQMSHGAFNAGAQAQDQRDAQRKLENRERHEEVLENPIDWHGAVAHEGLGTTKDIGMGLVKAVGGAGSAFMNTDVGAQKVTEASDHVFGKAPDPKDLTQHQRNIEAAKKFGKGALADQAVPMAKSAGGAAMNAYASYKASASGASQVPALEPQLESARGRANLEAERAAAREAYAEPGPDPSSGAPDEELRPEDMV